MPIYRFRCPDCLKEEEVILPMSERNNRRVHSCGAVMERLMSVPAPAIFLETGRDTVLDTLNKGGGHNFPGGDKHRPRYEQAMAKGLDPPKPVIGKGF
jgi:putative FmdB family regulatory protein